MGKNLLRWCIFQLIFFILIQYEEKRKDFSSAIHAKGEAWNVAEGLGERRVNTFAPQMSAIKGCPHVLRCVVNTFAPQMSAIKGCPHVLRCGVPQLESQGENPKFQGF